jgi:hypothetical protein
MELTQPVRILMYLFFPVLFFLSHCWKEASGGDVPPKNQSDMGWDGA